MSQMTLDFASTPKPVAPAITVHELRRRGAIEAIDQHFASTVARLAGCPDDEAVGVVLALVCRAQRAGHVCLDLRSSIAIEVLDDEGTPLIFSWPDAMKTTEILQRSGAAGDGTGATPLVVDRQRLYLHRNWEHEVALAREFGRRAGMPAQELTPARAAQLHALFPEAQVGNGPNWQKIAAATALTRNFCVVTGGPGTGKTSTVVRILAALLAEQEDLDAFHVLLLAPTGKAAARLSESVASARDQLPIPQALRAALPTDASTIHRALGVQRGGGGFRRGADNPLGADVVVVDEASMVDLALMRALVEALSPTARLILLGDRDQLASVEAGAVLGDLCGGARSRVGPEIAAAARDLCQVEVAVAQGSPPIANCIVELQHSYRFDASGGIGKLAQAIVRGDADAVDALVGGDDPQVRWLEPEVDDGRLEELVAEAYSALVRADADVRASLSALSAFRILCAHRVGRRGVEATNELVVRTLGRRGLVQAGGEFYPGRPILVTANDHDQGLYNGDVGVCDGNRVAFPGRDGIRLLSPSRLPAHESVYAMSVHKSQGSEFDEVVVVLPTRASPVLTRELLYTAVTRARTRVFLMGDRELIRLAVNTRVARASGLQGRLWSP